MKKIIALLLGLLGLTTNASAQSDSIKTVDAAQFAEFIKSDSVFLVDVRTAEEYAAGHIPNAKNVDVLNYGMSQGQVIDIMTYNSYSLQYYSF